MEAALADTSRLNASYHDDDSSINSYYIRERGDEAGPTCCLGMKTPSIILRNMIVPKEMWDEFPKGLTLRVSDQFLYQPGHPRRQNTENDMRKPSEFSMSYEPIWITAKDNVKIFAYLIKQNTASLINSLPTMIFFHGNAGNIGDRLDNAKLLHQNLAMNIFLVEYRGYGPSKGVPSEKGLYLDAKAAFEYLEGRGDLNPKKILVFGRSLGGGVAVDLCSRKGIRKRVAGLIVENTFTSVPSLGKKIMDFPGIRFLPRWMFNNKFNNKKKIGKVRCPTLFINSKNDELIPKGMMEKLFNMCGAPKKKFADVYAGHNDAFLCDEYCNILYDFLQAVFLPLAKPLTEGTTESTEALLTPPDQHKKQSEHLYWTTKVVGVEKEDPDEDSDWEDLLNLSTEQYAELFKSYKDNLNQNCKSTTDTQEPKEETPPVSTNGNFSEIPLSPSPP